MTSNDFLTKYGLPVAADAELAALLAVPVSEGLRALSDAATPGPWETGDRPGDLDAIRSVVATGYDRDEGEQTYLVAWCHGDWRADEDAALIVAAVNALRAALAERGTE